MTPNRAGASIVETLVVIAILGVLLALLFPALQSAHRRALEAECKNNLHQVNLAITQFAETHKRLPGPGSKGLVGGWTINVLPFLEQKNLRDRVTPGQPIQAAPEFLVRQPPILRCPVRADAEPAANKMNPAHYVFVPHDRRKTFHVFDMPVEQNIPWASGPEMTYPAVGRQTGPHHRGFFYARGFQQGVDFMPGRGDTR